MSSPLRSWIRETSLLALSLALFSGCGSNSSNRPQESTAKPDASPLSQAPGTQGRSKPRIALIMKSLANEFFLTMENGAKAHQESHADEYELLANGIKDELDVARQIELVEQMCAQGVDAIVIAPADSKALVNVCKKAMDEGIIVVNIDNQFDSQVLQEKNIRIPFVGPDNRKGAKLAGDYLARSLSKGDPVAILEGVPSAFNAIQRKAGFEDSAREAGWNVVSSQSALWETEKANQVMAGIMTEHPDLKAVLCANDSMAIGAVAALKGAGKLDQVKVVGYDNISAIQQMIRDGRVLCTIDQHADRLAVFGIEYALEMLREKIQPEDRETQVDLITVDTLQSRE
jgi:ribose transport system substrate-binding protein